MRENWYEEFFQGVALDLWSRACPQPMTEKEADAIENLLELTSPSTLLDVPCGPGRHVLELASRGHAIKALDISEDACRRLAKEISSRPGFDIELQVGDMRHIPWVDCCDGAVCMGNSFGYLDRTGSLEFLKSLSRALRPRKRFLLDSGAIAESLLPSLDERNWYQVEGITMLIENEYDVSRGLLRTDYTFISEEGRETRTAYHYIFTVSELATMLEESGFRIESLFSSPDLEPFDFGDPRLLLLARKED